MKVSCLLSAALVALSSFATDYYVAKDGVDDGVEGRGRSAEMPYATITYALGKAKTSGDHVYVAEGTYQERNLTIAAGVGLIATGRRDYTVIDAHASETDNARCVDLTGAKAYVKGFTIQNGWVPSSPETNGGGVQAVENAAVIDCAIRKCRGYRGGGGKGGVWIRCYFASDNVSGWNLSAKGLYGPAFVANCVFDGAGCVCNSAGKKVVNCTFRGSTYVGTNSSGYWPDVYNSIVDYIQSAAALYNTVSYRYGGTESAIKATDDKCLFNPPVTETSPSIAYDAGFVPLATASALVGCGNLSYYEDSFPADWKEIGEWRKAYGGGARVAGNTIDIGAGEFSVWNIPGMSLATKDLGDGRTRLSISQDSASDRYVCGFTFDGEAVSFDANTPGWTWSTVITDDPDRHAIVPAYSDVNCYYVDGTNGNDGDSGVGRSHAVKTIQTAMAKVAKGGTIRVMPGIYRYDENYAVDGYGFSNVVYFSKQNVTLIGVRGAKWTVLEGNPVAGAGGVRCVRIASDDAGSVVRGFTLRNGGTSGGDGNGNGGGILYGTAVDCVITGCRASGRGGAAYGTTLVRCYAEDCTIAAGAGTGMEKGAMYGSVFKGLTYYGGGVNKAVNCTFIGQGKYGAVNGNGSQIPVYNCLLIGGNSSAQNGGGAFHNSVLTGGTYSKDTLDDCIVNADAADYAYDATTFRPLAGSKLIDAGSDTYYEEQYAVCKDEYLDIAGGARIAGAAIDIGAGEYTPFGNLSEKLSPDGRVTVTAADAAVRETSGGAAAIPAGASLTLDWDAPINATAAATFHYTVTLMDGATLKVYEFGELFQEITASGTYTFLSPYGHRLTFAAEGTSGEAILYDLFNTSALTVVDEKGRMTVAGASVGTTELLPGSAPVVATFSRTDHDQPILTGIRVNGAFRSFVRDGKDVPQTVTVNADDGRTTVEAVYEYAWYVDAENGNDANDGKTPYTARKTLAAAMDLTTAYKQHVVHAAPGVYSEGLVWGTAGSYSATNRVVVKAGVGLVADQDPAVTVIEGAWAKGSTWGCGPDAVRCVLLEDGAWIQGFTVRNGGTDETDVYGGNGGGIYGKSSNCHAIDCIVENCRAVRGGGICGGNYIRCLLRGNDSANRVFPGLGTYDATGLYGCVFTDGKVYGSIEKIVSCSFVGTSLAGNNTWPHVYNSYVYKDEGKCKFHNSVIGTNVSTSQSTYDDGSTNIANVATVLFDVTGDEPSYRPLPTAKVLLDRGTYEAYATNWPVAWSNDTDLRGGPRVLGAAIDIGAGEFNWETMAKSGMTVAVTDLGGGIFRLSISQAFDSPKRCLGFTYEDETVLFDDHEPDYVWTKVTDGHPFAGKTLSPIYATADEWYVDGTNGDDGNIGYWTNVAFKTLAKAMSVAKSGAIVHVLPGVYRDTPMGRIGGYLTSNRVIVPNGVGVVADFGPDVTAIEGDISGEPGWTNSVRCVYLNPKAWIRGFTLRNGAAVETSPYGESGGAIAANAVSDQAVAVDCIIEGSQAVRGGGSVNVDTVRCLFRNNTASNGSGYYARHFDSYFAEGQNLYTSGLTVNCTVHGMFWCMSGYVDVYNSLLGTDYSRVHYHNCCIRDPELRAAASDATSTLDDDSKLGEPDAFVFDATGRPAAGSTAIDKGKAEYRDLIPDYIRPFMTDEDFAHGKRVWGGTIDLGAGEYDWRPAFGKRLGARIKVIEAGQNVVIDENTVRIPAGERIAGVWTMKYDTTYYFTVTADATATVAVTLDGKALTPGAGGLYTIDGTAGAYAFEISVTGEGAAKAGGFRADRGSVLILR